MKEKEKLPDTINLEFGFEMADTVTINGREYRAVESAKEPEVNPWPQEGDVYWHLDDCEADCDTWQDAILDRFRHERGLVFRTAEEAKHADLLRIANAEIRDWIAENVGAVDMRDGTEKACLCWDYYQKEWQWISYNGTAPPDAFIVPVGRYSEMMEACKEPFAVIAEGLK